jgi:CubicO group peptidase (beta-lactamase class C family)
VVLFLSVAVLSVVPSFRPSVLAAQEATFARIDSIARASLPALQAMVVLRDGKQLWEKYWSGADSSTAFNVKSVSKTFLSAMVGIAIEQKKLSLDQTIASILPEYYKHEVPQNRMFRAAVLRNDSMRATITVRHLLSQTSGISWDEGGAILSTFLVSSDPARLMAEQIMAAAPGTVWNYSTGNTHLLATALERAVVTSLRPYVEKTLLVPAGIQLRDWLVDGAGRPLGGSEMFFTARSLARFGQLYLNGGKIDGKQVVPADWVATSWEKKSDVASPIYKEMVPGITGYGYLWWLRTSNGKVMNCALGYGGQYVLVVPELKLVIAGASALDARNPGLIPQFKGIFGLVDQIVDAVGRQP